MKEEIEELEIPTKDFVKSKINMFDNQDDEPRKINTDVNYPAIKNSDLALISLLKKFPQNNVLSEVYLKVVAINALYSTSIYDTYRMAVRIFTLNIDERLLNEN